MKKTNIFIAFVILITLGIISFLLYHLEGLIIFTGFLVFMEFFSFKLIHRLRKQSHLFITPEDETPELSREGLQKFFSRGYDPELGWVRKPNTQKEETNKFGRTVYKINEKGARQNPEHEHLPIKISCHGDSFTFSRQVNDDETWEWFLSKLTGTNVLNYGVGNYGIDQALLRLKREYEKNPTEVVIMGVVPSTIIRILSVWKHYHEYGNTFGFKPFFRIEEDKFKLYHNPIDSKEKFFNYKKYIPFFQKHDYFYKTKFKKEMFVFPYFVSILSNPFRNIPLITVFSLSKILNITKNNKFEKNNKNNNSKIMNLLIWTKLMLFTPTKCRLFKKNENAVKLLAKIVEEFKRFGEEQNFIPILLWMPQKDDILYMKRKGIYYNKFMKNISKTIKTIDLTSYFMQRKNLDNLFTDDNSDGGHFSKEGNRIVAEIVYKETEDIIKSN